MGFCPGCGSQVAEAVMFCNGCGYNLQITSTNQPKVETKAVAPQTEDRTPAIALILALLPGVWGIGQIYVKDYFLGVVLLIVSSLLLFWTIFWLVFFFPIALPFMFLGFVGWLIQGYHAYHKAQKQQSK